MTCKEKKVAKAIQTIQKNADPLFFLAMVRGICPHGIGLRSHFLNMCHDNNLCDKCWFLALEAMA